MALVTAILLLAFFRPPLKKEPKIVEEPLLVP
jgi:hypothetical protein